MEIDLLVRLFDVKDTPELLSMTGEDQFITRMRHLYHFVLRRQDANYPEFKELVVDGLRREVAKLEGIEVPHADVD